MDIYILGGSRGPFGPPPRGGDAGHPVSVHYAASAPLVPLGKRRGVRWAVVDSGDSPPPPGQLSQRSSLCSSFAQNVRCVIVRPYCLPSDVADCQWASRTIDRDPTMAYGGGSQGSTAGRESSRGGKRAIHPTCALRRRIALG